MDGLPVWPRWMAFDPSGRATVPQIKALAADLSVDPDPVGLVESLRLPLAGQLPGTCRANCLGEGRDIVVGVGVAERLAGGVKQVLAVYEGDCALVWRFAARWPIGKE